MTQSKKAPVRSAFVLAIDVGNTLTRFGLFEGDELASTWCVTTRPVITVDEAHAMLREFFLIRGFSSASHEVSIERAIVSSVVPSITDAWVQAAHAASASRPLVVGPGLKTGLKMRFDDPGEVGSDRIADMVAAKELFHLLLSTSGRRRTSRSSTRTARLQAASSRLACAFPFRRSLLRQRGCPWLR